MRNNEFLDQDQITSIDGYHVYVFDDNSNKSKKYTCNTRAEVESVIKGIDTFHHKNMHITDVTPFQKNPYYIKDYSKEY